MEVLRALETMIERNPRHPLALHLYIHAVETSSTPGRAEPAADHLAGKVPGPGHLVHMPAHIYWRVGREVRLDSLGAALLEAGRAANAEEVYREDLSQYPHNGGDEAEAVRDDLAMAWAQADVQPPGSRF